MTTTNNKAETVAIFGATGITGKHLVQESLKQGYQVRAMVRNPAKMKAWMETQELVDDTKVHVVKGDVMSTNKAELEAALRETLQDADYVISALGGGNSYTRFQYPRLFLTNFLQQDLMPFLNKQDDNYAKTFVYTAAMFCPKPDGTDLPWYMRGLKVLASVIGGMGPTMEDHDSAVRYLGTIDTTTNHMKIVVVRPGALEDSYSLGKPLVTTPTPYLGGKMGQQDLALCLLKCATKDADHLQGQFPFLCPDTATQ
jgi:hypothetical protein